jgi:hypothetical protein
VAADEDAVGDDEPPIEESDLVEQLERRPTVAPGDLLELDGCLRGMDRHGDVQGRGAFRGAAEQLRRARVDLGGSEKAPNAPVVRPRVGLHEFHCSLEVGQTLIVSPHIFHPPTVGGVPPA